MAGVTGGPLVATHWIVAVPTDLGAAKAVERFKSAMIEAAGRPLAGTSSRAPAFPRRGRAPALRLVRCAAVCGAPGI